mmetsp:Transcript_17904/g.23585  ORF Transcript_17904/g.23585 Transcript_17904/m.23585 type:complete len:276 (+) Transcript_17904:116-943(+)|eukprot:CAMPEP_0117751834 /NCGR_PEP_ID=MMETSP0947-20121206/11224_1 /TAXON_ID=44440 /ORGANISM="Chattonella subsalsa, Strain CCMP2191" /LENGTH=275 /DNA_ID=CAMNT_0005570317 /DNA_START=74 /DNA_END=901 /DNA_ORIENTATION=+
MEDAAIFDRQIRIDNWQQDKVQEQVCFLLGAGGLGCTVALALVRMGVGKIILLDRDVVEPSNLNRQVLFSKEDVGKSKCEAAKECLERSHTVASYTEVECHHMCALENWNKIVQIAQQSTVIFNMIDVGDYFDAAVGSLCLKLQIPMIQGGTFCQQFTVDFFKPDGSCICCSADSFKNDELEKILPSKISDIENLDFIPRNENPVGQSTSYLCCMCSNMMVARFGTFLLNDPEVPIHERFIMTVNSGEAFAFPVEKEPNCIFCLDLAEMNTKEIK